MNPSAPRTAELAAATALAVLLGLLWWTGAAPPPGTSSAHLPPPAISAPPGPTDPAWQPDDPSQAVAVVPYPDVAELLTFDVAAVDALLPERGDVIRRRSGVLTADTVLDYSGVVPASGQFLLEYVCQGDGELRVETGLPDGQWQVRLHPCDGTVGAASITTTSAGQATIQVAARTTAFVGMAVQLVRLRPA